MELDLFNNEAGKIWKKVTSDAAHPQLQNEFDLFKKVFNFLQVGDYFYWIFNLKDYCLDVVSNDVKKVLGYEANEFTLEYLMENIHPEDRPIFLNFENKAGEFLATLPLDKLMKYKVRYDFRMKTRHNTYVRLLHQSIVIQHDEKGQILRTMGSETDITHLRTEGRPILSFIGLDDEPSYINVDVDKIFTISNEPLSKREKQILKLIADGKLSKEISEILHISKQTVDSHRNNMLEKNKVKNTSQLITTAIRNGWI